MWKKLHTRSVSFLSVFSDVVPGFLITVSGCSRSSPKEYGVMHRDFLRLSNRLPQGILSFPQFLFIGCHLEWRQGFSINFQLTPKKRSWEVSFVFWITNKIISQKFSFWVRISLSRLSTFGENIGPYLGYFIFSVHNSPLILFWCHGC